MTTQDVIEFVRARLASYKKPRHVVFVDHLPRNAANKVLKKKAADVAIKELGLDASAGELGSCVR